MNRTPQYLVIGSGRMAMHFSYYLKLLGLPYQKWSRKKNTDAELLKYVEICSHVLLLISDDAISDFLYQHDFLLSSTCVHFSGALVVKGLFSAHPLMTFTHEKYDLPTYRNIPFILEEKGPNLADLLPGLPNKAFKVTSELKPLYHALIVMGNNFTTMLWQHLFERFQHDLHLPMDAIFPILKQTMNNLVSHPGNALTGPLTRKDQNITQMHLKALEGSPYKNVYQSFINAFHASQK